MQEMTDDDSTRLFDQRSRNRMSEALQMLVDWDETVPNLGAQAYFSSFFEWFPADEGLAVWPNSTLTGPELHMLTAVRLLMDEAADATSEEDDADELLDSGWPQRIAPVAGATLDLMRLRGDFSEEVEEDEPAASPEQEEGGGWFRPVFKALAAVRQGRR